MLKLSYGTGVLFNRFSSGSGSLMSGILGDFFLRAWKGSECGISSVFNCQEGHGGVTDSFITTFNSWELARWRLCCLSANVPIIVLTSGCQMCHLDSQPPCPRELPAFLPYFFSTDGLLRVFLAAAPNPYVEYID
jgi:hypothetical protein